MKSLREQIIDRISSLGGEDAEYYQEYSDYDLLEDFENLLRINIEEENEHEQQTYKDSDS